MSARSHSTRIRQFQLTPHDAHAPCAESPIHRDCSFVNLSISRLAPAGRQAGYPVRLAANAIQGIAEGAMDTITWGGLRSGFERLGKACAIDPPVKWVGDLIAIGNRWSGEWK